MKNIFIFSSIILVTCCICSLGFSENNNAPQFTEVSVHDPDVIKVENTYYVFGSHLASAKSNDLIKWSQISTDLPQIRVKNPLVSDQFYSEFKEVFDLIGNIDTWASSIIELNGKYYMYLSVSSWGSPKSAIVLAISDKVEGYYRYETIVLTSGFEEGYNPMIHPNAIDPHVFFDKEGNLWMVYGSYFGGIYILKMNPKTGLPFENQGYGEKLAGGFHAPMEGPYILYSPHTDYYYLFLSFGTLSTDGGYNIRVARSKNPNGPYFDSMNNNMIDAKGNSFDSYGTKLIGNFLFKDSSIGYVSPGHNSAFYDSDLNKYFIFFHTRFPNRGEIHNLRVHQLLFNEDGWPLIAPHRYSGMESYGIQREQVSGTYQFINHGRDTSSLIKESTYIKLNPNGSILIDDKVKGSWYLNQENQITLILEEKIYNGIILKQWDNGLEKEVISFTALSSETGVTIWGSKLCQLEEVQTQ